MINNVKCLKEVYEDGTCLLTSMQVCSYGVTKKHNCTLFRILTMESTLVSRKEVIQLQIIHQLLLDSPFKKILTPQAKFKLAIIVYIVPHPFSVNWYNFSMFPIMGYTLTRNKQVN